MSLKRKTLSADAKDWQGEAFEPSFRQGTIACSVDGFVEQFALPFPNQVKIDVNGIEEHILEGARRTNLRRETEVSTRGAEHGRWVSYKRMLKRILGCNMKVQAKKHSAMIEAGGFPSLYNHIFVRA